MPTAWVLGSQLLLVAQQVRRMDERLKKPLAESMLENEVTREARRKKW
jgi:hypothetical protein